MKSISFLLLLSVITIALAYPDVQSKEARKPAPEPCWDCARGYHGHEPHHPGSHHYCKDLCDEQPRVTTKIVGPYIRQAITEDTVLVCTKESHFDYIRFNGVYEDNTTCNGVIVETADYFQGIYVAGKYNKNGIPREESLNGKYGQEILTVNNGNAKRLEQAELTDCNCEGDVLRSIASWVADNPLTGCCNEGVNHLQSTAYKLNIFGKCCSECYLLQSSLSWCKPVKN